MKSLIFRGAVDAIVKEDIEKALESKTKLRIKFGIDATAERIHIGHASTIRKLKHFQDMGHQIVLIVGDFTARIGDPSDKDSERQPLTEKEIKSNLKGYEQQLGKILDTSKAEIHYNSEWLGKFKLADWLLYAQQFSVAQMLERDNFAERFKAEKRIGLQEFQYPLLQGYDSVAVKADIEIGGTDQLFNLLAGRTAQKFYEQRPQNIITYQLLVGSDGRKMSKSWGNTIWIDDSPTDMYGKLMAVHDERVAEYLQICTDLDDSEIKKLIAAMNTEPREAKGRMAEEITKIYHGEKAAKAAAAGFSTQFSEGGLPSDIPSVKLAKKAWAVEELLVATKLVVSKSEARRLYEQGGVRLNSKQLEINTVEVKSGDIIQVGKRRFARVA